MVNHDTRAVWNYHNGTKHPGGPLLDPHHRYNPMRNPLPFKIYEGLDPIPLSLDISVTGMPALSAIATQVGPIPRGQVPDIATVTRVLHFSAGITKTLRSPWGDMPFRAAACTGGLYHIELYLVCGDLTGLDAGVYHFDPSESALRCLRKGDYRRALVDATGEEPAVANAPAILVYTDVFWRNAVKYQAREYRHAFWDSGTIIANTLAISAASGLPAKVVIGFVDDHVNQLLSVDDQREVAVALIALGHASVTAPGHPAEIGPLGIKATLDSDHEVDFPPIREMHQASSLASRVEVVAWREEREAVRAVPASGSPIPIELQAPDTSPTDSIETVITRRGSTREFSRDSVTFSELSTILDRACRKMPADYLAPRAGALTDIYLIVNEVDDLRSGSYAYRRGGRTLESVREGEFRQEAGQLALGQALGADASVNIYFMADLAPILNRLGNRGYRAAQLEASITAGRIYLAAYALGLGATGLTFYDDAVTEFFSPHAEGKSAMFLVAVGRKARRR